MEGTRASPGLQWRTRCTREHGRSVHACVCLYVCMCACAPACACVRACVYVYVCLCLGMCNVTLLMYHLLSAPGSSTQHARSRGSSPRGQSGRRSSLLDAGRSGRTPNTAIRTPSAGAGRPRKGRQPISSSHIKMPRLYTSACVCVCTCGICANH